MADKEGSTEVTIELRAAAAALKPGEMLSTRLSLYDAMQAIEIGDPRVDTGVITRDVVLQPPFDPSRVLLPDEVCAVMDQLLRAEATWHAGHPLSQTLYTCLYLSQPDAFHRFEAANTTSAAVSDPSSQLTLLVLRAYVVATAKCCEVVWEEYVRGNLIPMEVSDAFLVSSSASIWIAKRN